MTLSIFIGVDRNLSAITDVCLVPRGQGSVERQPTLGVPLG